MLTDLQALDRGKREQEQACAVEKDANKGSQVGFLKDGSQGCHQKASTQKRWTKSAEV